MADAPKTGQLVLSIDAMGGDNAPGAVLDGIDIARVRHPGVRFLLHGDKGELERLMAGDAGLLAVAEIRHAPDVVGMDDKPSQALRRGRETSMWRALESVKAGEAAGAVSAGNTGALMAMSKFQLRPLDGIARPAIAALWPTMHGQSVVLDVGANVGSEARHLVDFAVMGAAFARAVFGLKTPSVGLLNIGSEELKGNEQVKVAAQSLRDAGLDIAFAGFIEGDDISAGTVDVVVTDGFTGNIALKAAEGTAKLVSHYLREALKRSLLTKIGAFLASGAFRILKARMDPRAVNGGVFLGLNGIVVKSHGGTDGIGFAAAIDLAIDMAKQDMVRRIADDIKGVSGVLSRLAPAAPDATDAAAVPPA
ncbi:MAG: phosphate acyltransferase PlsX [Alphaproteobacteria bacterium]|nr:phosphate acyltransferase PlsX [Alphaproteobacteria bacterium]